MLSKNARIAFWKNSPDVSVYHDSVSPRRTQSSLLLYINKMMCERRDQTYFSERDAKRTNSQARDPIGQRALYAELGYRRKPHAESIWPQPVPWVDACAR